MPVRLIGRDTKITPENGIVDIIANNADFSTARGASSGTIQTSNVARVLINYAPIAGGIYGIRRHVALLDFSKLGFKLKRFPTTNDFRIIKLQLIVSTESSPGFLHNDTNGEKIRIGHLSNPVSAGSVSAGDFDITRHDLTSFSDALALADATNNQVFDISNPKLMKQMQIAIAKQSTMHLSVLNELDFSNTEPTAGNRFDFDALNVINTQGSMAIKVFYRFLNNIKNPGGRGAGGVASAGFGGTDLFCGTNSGFSN